MWCYKISSLYILHFGRLAAWYEKSLSMKKLNISINFHAKLGDETLTTVLAMRSVWLKQFKFHIGWKNTKAKVNFQGTAMDINFISL